MNISYVPEICKGENPQYTGSIVLRLPSSDERIDYLADSGFNLSDPRSKENLKATSYLMKKVYDHIVKVDMKRTSDGKKLATLEDLRFEEGLFPTLITMANEIMSGFTVGKI